MKWLPYDCWTIESPLDVATLVAGMQQRIAPRKWLRLGSVHAALEGTVHERGFSANRITGYRNSFLPMLYGEFLAGQRGTTIRVRMTLHPLVVAFMVYWLSWAGMFAIAGIVVALTDQEWWLALSSGGMILFMIALVYASFWAEAGKAKRLLSEVFAEVHKAAGKHVHRS